MQKDITINRRGGIFYGWWVLLACVIGLLVGPGQFVFGSLGLFIIPMQEEFGWRRSEISLASSFFTVALIFSMPIAGRLVDHYGGRKILLPSMIIVALSLAILPLVVSQLWHLYIVFLLIGSLGAAANSLPFMLAISSWFNRRRGTAIGIAMAGSGLGYAGVPPLVQFVNSHFGWHLGYYTLAAIILFFAIPLIAVLYRNRPEDSGLLPDGDTVDVNIPAASSPQEAGLTRHDALRSRTFWLLTCIFSLLAFCLFGLLQHMVPMLIDRGMVPVNAALVASIVGITILCVRVPIGYFMDRFFAPYVALFCFLLSALGIGIFASGVTGFPAYVAAVFVGFSIGAEIDLLAFLAGRYFGLKNFGQIYGLLFASMMLGVSLGPPIFGYCFDTLGNYTAILSVSCLLVIGASLMTGLLPKYPDFAVHNNQ